MWTPPSPAPPLQSSVEDSHWLPDIDVTVPGDMDAFFIGMGEIAEATARFDVDHHRDGAGGVGFRATNFGLSTPHRHQDLGLQFIHWPDAPNRIRVEVRAHRWDPDPPTCRIYCDAAKELAGPLLTAFNRVHGTRLRLRIERHRRRGFRISERSLVLLDRFALLANATSLHPLDWDRFYRLAAEGRQTLPEAVLHAALIERGFRLDKAAALAELYTHLRAFKRRL